MKLGLRIALLVVGLFVAFFALQMAASESGEVVVVTTTDATTHKASNTRLWVVDHDQHAWIRAGSPTSGWYKRLSVVPTIQVQRGASKQTYIAVQEPTQLAAINALYAAKYGWADNLVAVMIDHRASVPIRLDPVSPTP